MYDTHKKKKKKKLHKRLEKKKRKLKGEKIDTGEINNVKKVTFFGHMVN